MGRNIGKRAILILRVDDVSYEFLRERSDVKVVAPRSPENAGIPHPAQTFVSLWTIGRNAEKVSALSPGANRPHFVDQFARGDKSGRWFVGDAADYITFQRLEGRHSGIASDFDVAETVKRKVRTEGLFFVPSQDIDIGSIGVAEIGGIDCSIRAKDFCKTQLDPGTGAAFHLQHGPTHHVLTHIEDVGSACNGSNFLGAEGGDNSRRCS